MKAGFLAPLSKSPRIYIFLKYLLPQLPIFAPRKNRPNPIMKIMLQKALLLALATLLIPTFVHAQDGKVAIAAHRGFWQAESAQGAQNSIAALKESIENNFWGSELDVHLTSDNVIIVNHDGSIQGIEIRSNPYSAFADFRLKNGESVPSLDEYLTVARKGKKCMIVLEIKDQRDHEKNIVLTKLAIQALKEGKVYKPNRAMFISFALDVCEFLAKEAPDFTNQYLSGDKSPAELKEMGINGLDYHYKKFQNHPEWVAEAHALGMSVNVWTVDDEEVMREMIDLGVDCITTNKPLVLRGILGEHERKN